MNKIITAILLLSAAFNSIAQSSTETSAFSHIIISPYVSDQVEDFPESARGMLAGKLASILTANEVSGAGNSRFVLTANIVVANKEITASAPPMHAFALETTLFIADAVDRKAYASVSISLKGVGENETKAYMNAIKNLKTDDPRLKTFVEEAKKKITNYYNTECDLILKRAQAAADMQNYEEAIFNLNMIPAGAGDCYEKSLKMTGAIYKKHIDFDCKKRLMDARALWATKQNTQGAQEVAQILSKINPSAACYAEAQTFVGEMKKRILEVDQREWDFVLQVEEDVADVAKEQLKNYRDISVTYAENQPQSLSYNLKGWLW